MQLLLVAPCWRMRRHLLRCSLQRQPHTLDKQICGPTMSPLRFQPGELSARDLPQPLSQADAKQARFVAYAGLVSAGRLICDTLHRATVAAHAESSWQGGCRRSRPHCPTTTCPVCCAEPSSAQRRSWPGTKHARRCRRLHNRSHPVTPRRDRVTRLCDALRELSTTVVIAATATMPWPC